MDDYSDARHGNRLEASGHDGVFRTGPDTELTKACHKADKGTDVSGSYDISIVMPCLNEEATVGRCVEDAFRSFRKMRLNGEVIVIDNASTDASAMEAAAHGARVITESGKGYGRAIRTGIAHSLGNVIIIVDCDTTYDLYDIGKLYRPLSNGTCDMVIGDRFGNIEKGAMSITHRLGVMFLSFIGRKRFHVNVHDFHCGLRGMTREATEKVELTTDGMEFATEMIAEASRKRLRIGQTRVVLRKSPAERQSKLRTFRDGLRHILYMYGCKCP